MDGDGFWLVFHHPHRERGATACLHFGLQIETHPIGDVDQMTVCDGTEVSPTDQFPDSIERSYDLSNSQHSNEVFQISHPHLLLKQEQEGFLQKVHFKLTQASWVAAEIGYNFFTSHGEMDIVRADHESSAKPLVASRFDFIHGEGHRLDGRLLLGETLPAGAYTLRVADDHYNGQVSSQASHRCFPFSFDFTVVPSRAAPTIVSVVPHPSVPLIPGADLVVTLRFSEPPHGDLGEVVSQISLGGLAADVGGSIKHLKSVYHRREASVEVSTAEHHKVWIISFNADQVLPGEDLTLRIGDLKGNVTKKPFQFNPPTYTVAASAASSGPWHGGADAVAQPAPVDSARPTGGSSGAFLPPSPSSNVGGVGQAHLESGSNAPALIAGGSSVGKVNFGFNRPFGGVADHHLDAAIVPNVEVWQPVRAAPAPAPPQQQPTLTGGDGCPEGTVMNAETRVCEVGSSWPVGWHIVMLATLGVAAYIGFSYAHQIPSFMQGLTKSGPTQQSRRFRDVGHRTSEEELGLVSHRDMEDDML